MFGLLWWNECLSRVRQAKVLLGERQNPSSNQVLSFSLARPLPWSAVMHRAAPRRRRVFDHDVEGIAAGCQRYGLKSARTEFTLIQVNQVRGVCYSS